jgi:hypothetical protein
MSEELICSGKKLGRDLVADSLIIAGKVPVREVLILTPPDVCGKRSGQNMFKYSYRVGNIGFMASRGFENLTYFWDLKDKNNDKVVSRQPGMSLGPNEYKVIDDEISFNLKDSVLRDGMLLLRLDAFSKIAEDNETNNEISTKLLFRGFQSGYSTTPMLHVEFLRVGAKNALQGKVNLTKKESKGVKESRHAFAVEFVVRNYGVKPATGFDVLYLLDGKKFSRQKDLALKPGESQLIQTQVYFPIHNGRFTVQVDPDQIYPKATGCNLTADIQVFFQGL